MHESKAMDAFYAHSDIYNFTVCWEPRDLFIGYECENRAKSLASSFDSVTDGLFVELFDFSMTSITSREELVKSSMNLILIMREPGEHSRSDIIFRNFSLPAHKKNKLSQILPDQNQARAFL